MRRLYDWVLSWAETRYGTPALALVSFTESSFFPIPPDPLLMALSLGRPKRSAVYATICTVASVLGGLLGYWIGLEAFEYVGRPIVDFYGKHDIYQGLQAKFTEYGFLTILTVALTPIPYKVFTIAAGSFHLDLPTFIAASILGRGLRFYAVGILIQCFGEPIRAFIDRYFEWLAVLFTVLLITGFLVLKRVL
ncbi:MAG: YqaA family protein [Planctomycetota bacterium]